MLSLGIFSHTFERPTLHDVLDTIASYGFGATQFNFSSAQLPSLPTELQPTLTADIGTALAERAISMSAVSGTYNIIHPDPAVRGAGRASVRCLAAACAALGTRVITISTGTLNPHNMWQPHPDNQSDAAWADMVREMASLATIAEQAGVVVAFEPELANVVNSASAARRLLDELRSPAVGVVIDGANLFPLGSLPRMHDILSQAFDLLGPAIVLAHAKDLTHDGAAGHAAAGTGLLDYPLYIHLLASLNRPIPVVLHSLSEADVPTAVALLRSLMG